MADGSVMGARSSNSEGPSLGCSRAKAGRCMPDQLPSGSLLVRWEKTSRRRLPVLHHQFSMHSPQTVISRPAGNGLSCLISASSPGNAASTKAGLLSAAARSWLRVKVTDMGFPFWEAAIKSGLYRAATGACRLIISVILVCRQSVKR